MATKLTHLTDEDETAASLLLLGIVERIIALSAVVDEPTYTEKVRTVLKVVDEHLLLPLMDTMERKAQA